MPFAEAAIRGGAAALLLLLIVLSLREARRSPASRYGALFALCGLAYLVDSAPGFAEYRCPWLVPATMLGISSPGVFWLWAAAHFDDGFTPSWRNWLPWWGLLAAGGIALVAHRRVVWLGLEAAELIIVGFGLWLIVAGRNTDLIESRRRLRVSLAIGAALVIVGLVVIDFALQAQPGMMLSIVITSGLAALAFSFVLLRVAPAPQAAAQVPVGLEPARLSPVPRPAGPIQIGDSDEEAGLHARLNRLMQVDKVYREEGLSVASLAARLGIPEYRLRRLINQRLGHRNFTAFVNGYRLTEAEAALADPAQARVPILTIALDAGFQSIGPFNRAFKAQTGMTPSEYRRDRLTGFDEASAAE